MHSFTHTQLQHRSGWTQPIDRRVCIVYPKCGWSYYTSSVKGNLITCLFAQYFSTANASTFLHTHTRTHVLTRTLPPTPIYSLTHPSALTRSLTHTYTHAFNHSLTPITQQGTKHISSLKIAKHFSSLKITKLFSSDDLSEWR